jgi:HAD superfamily hydrolase (TIGR01509 family)
MIKAILMDFNGVVIDDEPLQLEAYKKILAEEGITLTDEDYYSCLGMDDASFIEAAYARAGKTPEPNKVLDITQRKTGRWLETISKGVPLFPGVEDFIRKCSRELTLGLVSMARREEIGVVLEAAGLTDCFSVIVSAEDVENCKPDPECYRAGFRLIDAARSAKGHLPMTHGECVVIEDAPPGVAAGRGADLPVLGVTNTVSAEELRAAGAQVVTKDLDDWMPETFRRVFV